MITKRATGILIGLIACAELGVANAQVSAPVNTENATSPMGTNLHFLYDMTPEWFMVDAFAKSREWQAIDCGSGASLSNSVLTLDRGWVRETSRDNVCVYSFLYNNMADPFPYPAGTYTVFWEGPGTISAGFSDGSATLDLQETTLPTADIRRATFRVPAWRPLGLMITASPPTGQRTGYPRNIRVIVPGGVCGPRNQPDPIRQLDYFSACRSPETGGEGADACGVEQRCYKFEDVHYDRFHDSPALMNAPKVVFHPITLDRLKKYKAVRFMNWMESGTGETNVQRWDQRTPKEYQTLAHTGYGVAYEYMIALANVLNADMWINIPMLANDDYNTQLARMIRGDLAPATPGLRAGRKVYVEYVNEPWHVDDPTYPQGIYFRSQEAGCTRTSCPLQGSSVYARRATQIMDLWSPMFSGTDRLVRVLAGVLYLGGPTESGWNGLVLRQADTAAGGVARHFDSFTISPYVGVNFEHNRAEFTDTNVPRSVRAARVVDRLTTVDLPAVIEEVGASTDIAHAYGLNLVAYEGGQHLVPPSAEATAVYRIANALPAMGTFYTTLMAKWKTASPDLFMHYMNCSPWDDGGEWGLLRSQTDTRQNSPKYDAVMRFIEDNPTGSANPVPATATLSPNSATAGGPAFTLTVNGTNFVAGSQVFWSGAARPTTFVSATQLMTAITAADIAAAATINVAVNNPAPGGGVSNALTFTTGPRRAPPAAPRGLRLQ